MNARILGVFSLLLSIILEDSDAAPVVSAVHVRFVSGNQATEYGHGSLPDGTALHYSTVGLPTEHQLKRRSLPTPNPSAAPPSPNHFTSALIPVTLPSPRPRLRRKVGTQKQDDPMTPSGLDEKEGRVGVATEVLDVPDSDEGKAKKGAVKRSPLSRTFGPYLDFDQFRGNDYREGRPLENYAEGPSQHLNIQNAESLAPQGLFLPPLPTAASNHLVEDPYAADAETAKYAAQSPPYFHEFPHKRNVLYLNEERVENGLEPNILRSIRPFFPFFEINK